MLDGRELNRLENTRALLQAFGGLNETYACGEAELRRARNFSSRGYPALQTRPARRKVYEPLDNVHGVCRLNGMLLIDGTDLYYTPDDGSGMTVMNGAVQNSEKQMVGMGTKVLIWPDKKLFDTQSRTLTALEAGWDQSGGSLRVMPCDSSGASYTANVCSTAAPENPTNGMVWLKQATEAPWGYESVLKVYSAAGSWQTVPLNWLRVECSGIGRAFREGDTVTLAGIPAVVRNAYSRDLAGDVQLDLVEEDAVILAISPEADSVLYYGTMTVTAAGVAWVSLDGKTKQDFAGPNTSASARRRVPDLDFLTECDNRVWGCSSKENVIYACKLGDPTNWYSYRGTAADSYAVTVGSDGAFTGAATCLGDVLFFKEHCLHKLYGTKPSDFQMASVRCAGVAKGADRSLCVLDEVLFYLSYNGVMAWDGSLPEKVSGALDNRALAGAVWAAGGSLGERYYLYLDDGSADRLLVYDTDRGLWQEEDPAGREMLATGRQLYLWDGRAVWGVDPALDSGTEDRAAFEAVTGDLGAGVADDWYISRVTVRAEGDPGTVLTVWASYDGGEWEEAGHAEIRTARTRLNLPFVPQRCDTLRLRLTGEGQLAVRSIALTTAPARGGRVSGAVPHT